MQRLFIAIDMPPAIAAQLSALCRGVSGAKWADIAHFHLTLRFVGGADDRLLRDIELALAEFEALAFDVALGGVGYFPPRGPAKILWAGVEANPLLDRLRLQVVTARAALGLEPERRKFAPHITLARFQRDALPPQIGEFLTENALFRTAPFTVSKFHLYSSLLRPDGAVHRIEASYHLRGMKGMWDEEEFDF